METELKITEEELNELNDLFIKNLIEYVNKRNILCTQKLFNWTHYFKNNFLIINLIQCDLLQTIILKNTKKPFCITNEICRLIKAKNKFSKNETELKKFLDGNGIKY